MLDQDLVFCIDNQTLLFDNNMRSLTTAKLPPCATQDRYKLNQKGELPVRYQQSPYASTIVVVVASPRQDQKNAQPQETKTPKLYRPLRRRPPSPPPAAATACAGGRAGGARRPLANANGIAGSGIAASRKRGSG